MAKLHPNFVKPESIDFFWAIKKAADGNRTRDLRTTKKVFYFFYYYVFLNTLGLAIYLYQVL